MFMVSPLAIMGKGLKLFLERLKRSLSGISRQSARSSFGTFMVTQCFPSSSGALLTTWSPPGYSAPASGPFWLLGVVLVLRCFPGHSAPACQFVTSLGVQCSCPSAPSSLLGVFQITRRPRDHSTPSWLLGILPAMRFLPGWLAHL